MAQRKLTRKQIAAGFGGKAAQRRASGRRTVRRVKSTRRARKSTTMARSRRSRIGSAIRSRVNIKKIGIRAGAGALATYAPQVAGEYGPGLALTAVGIATRDDVVEGMGEVALGAALARTLGTSAGYAPPSGGSGLI